jgi:hypothetical protein
MYSYIVIGIYGDFGEFIIFCYIVMGNYGGFGDSLLVLPHQTCVLKA